MSSGELHDRGAIVYIYVLCTCALKLSRVGRPRYSIELFVFGGGWRGEERLDVELNPQQNPVNKLCGDVLVFDH